MTRIVVKKLIWDEWNIEHIKKHNVIENEAEEVSKSFLAHKVGKKGRYIAIGKSGSRLLSLVLDRKSTGEYYVVTARDASKKERREIYDKEKIQISRF